MNQITINSGAIDHISGLLPWAHAYVVIADANVAPLYGQRVAAQLPSAELLEFPAGEPNKNRETWSAICDLMLERGIGRDCCIIAVGGGVTCDLAGFVAATYMRGVPVVQVPTSLLAMIDAAIGGKTGVDTPAGKNLIGAFHQPAHVVIDPNVLSTLSDEDLSGGLAEAIKHGAIADAEYLDWIVTSRDAIFARDGETIEHLIRRSVEIKLAHVRDDQREKGMRAALNFGHTIAHALEREFDYSISHGQAVALGMIMEARIGVALGVTDADTPRLLQEAVVAADLPQFAGFDDFEALIEATRSDKKARSGAVRYVLLRKAGEVARTDTGEWTTPVPDDVVRGVLKQHWRV